MSISDGATACFHSLDFLVQFCTSLRGQLERWRGRGAIYAMREAGGGVAWPCPALGDSGVHDMNAAVHDSAEAVEPVE